MGRFGVRENLARPMAIAAVVAALGLAGCQQKSTSLEGADTMSTASTTPASYQETAALGKKWKADPKDINKGLAYANGLESLGQTEQQMQVLQALYKSHPGEPQLAAVYGKKLVAAGYSAEAVPVLETASAASKDWRIYSALGSAYDQQSLYDQARQSYAKALEFSPGNLTVLNNLGMSYALQGNLKEAEKVLLKADAMPNSASQPRIRQNLALVVGLQGRFEEASAIASKDLPPDQVEENMAYLKRMLSQPNTWQQISESSES